MGPLDGPNRPRSRLLAPTLGKERTKARKPLDIYGPTFSASPRKEGEVYHIFEPQGQTQFARREGGEQFGRGRLAPGQRQELVAPIGRAVARLDQPCRAAGGDGGANLLEAEDEVSSPPRKAQPIQNPLRKQRFDLVGQRFSGPRPRLGGARQRSGRRGLDGGPRRGDPDAAAGKLARDVGHDHAIRAGDEAHEARLVDRLAGRHVPPLAACRHARLRADGSGLLGVGERFLALGVLVLETLFDLRFRLDPAGRDAGPHDEGFGPIGRESELLEDARLAHALAVLGFEPAAQVVGHQAGEVFQGLHLALAQRHRHRQGHALDFQFAAALVIFGRFLFEVFAGARLQLLGRLLAEALDGGDFGRVHIGHVFDGGEALGDQQLGDHLVDVERLLEQLGPLGELALAPLGILALGHDVDLPAGQLAREAHVLAAPADGQRQLLVRNDDLDALVFLVHHHLGHFRRRERIDQEGGFVRRPGDDVDLLALQLGDHGLDAAAAHADAGADRVDGGIAGDHRHLRAAAWVAGDRADLDHPVVDLGHLLREQLGHEAAVRARQHDLRALGLPADVVDVAADAIADLKVLARDRLVAADDAFAAPEIDDDVAVLDALDDAVDDLADAVLELLVLALAFGVADLARHHLPGHLGLHAPELEGREHLLVGLPHEGVLVVELGVGERLERVGVLDRLLVVDDGDHAGDGGLAGLRIDVDADVVLGAVARARRLLHRLLDRLDDDLLLDGLLPRDRVGDLQELEPVCGNPGKGHGRYSDEASADACSR